MNAIPAQEIKRRGITAVDALLENGDVHVIRNNRAQYVVVSETRYQELMLAEESAALERVRASLEEVKRGKGRRFKNAAEVLRAIDELPAE